MYVTLDFFKVNILYLLHKRTSLFLEEKRNILVYFQVCQLLENNTVLHNKNKVHFRNYNSFLNKYFYLSLQLIYLLSVKIIY